MILRKGIAAMYDLIVCGGGLTGTAAAVAAAQEGLRVLIVEKSGFLGGAAVNCYVNPFMPYTIRLNGKRVMISRGIFAQIISKLAGMGGIAKEGDMVFNEECLKIILDELTSKSNVDVLFHTTLISAETDGASVRKITVANKSGITELETGYFIDATGDGELAAAAGAGFHVGREEDGQCQPMTLCFRIGNVDREKFDKTTYHQIKEAYNKAQSEGRISDPREDVLWFNYTVRDVIHFNTTRVLNLSPIDAVDLSKAEKEGRRQMYEIYLFLKKDIPGFENSVLLSSAPEIGIRESRMIDGEYVITKDDIIGCKKFDDSICVGAYEIDIHSPDGSGTTHISIPDGEYYTIPYRALIPKGFDNMLAAGRCISSTHEAQAAYRIMPICCCMGEAAGAAAALAFKNKSAMREVKTEALHRELEKRGLMY